MDLYLFPEAANDLNGYSICVDMGYRHYQPSPDDIVVWYSSYPADKMWHLRACDHVIKRPGLFSLKSIINLLKGTNRCEPFCRELTFLTGYSFERIYCDDTLFYHPVRRLFPNAEIVVRFHNCFARIRERLILIGRPVNWQFELTLRNMSRLEHDVMADPKAQKVFVTEEDRMYYISRYGADSCAEVFGYTLDMGKVIEVRKNLFSLDNRLIWFGGVESHKKASVKWFISEVWPELHRLRPELEFHLWGYRSSQYDDRWNNVFGHGRYEGTGFPSRCSLYVNPDVTGGGVKLKVKHMLEDGIPFISTPFGMEGYDDSLIDGKFCTVVAESSWVGTIITLLNRYGA